MTFTDFVNQYRISQARTLLLKDSGIAAVSDAAGFNETWSVGEFWQRDGHIQY